jgi:hypothetical protein
MRRSVANTPERIRQSSNTVVDDEEPRKEHSQRLFLRARIKDNCERLLLSSRSSMLLILVAIVIMTTCLNLNIITTSNDNKSVRGGTPNNRKEKRHIMIQLDRPDTSLLAVSKATPPPVPDNDWLGEEWKDQECRPMHKWQLQEYSPYSCNVMHEIYLHDASFIAKGGSRLAFSLSDTNGGETMVIKTPK